MTDFGRGWRPSRLENSSSQLAERINELRSKLQFRDPLLVAARCGISFETLSPDRGEFHISFFGKAFTLPWPTLTGYTHSDDELDLISLALMLYYLFKADGTTLADKWVSFADLPDGRLYNTAYQASSGDVIVKGFGSDIPAFRSACLNAGGKPVEVGSASYRILAFPNLPMLVTCWLGDEDFPSSCKILFDSSATHYLPIEGCAIAGRLLTKKLLSPRSPDFEKHNNIPAPTSGEVGDRFNGEL